MRILSPYERAMELKAMESEFTVRRAMQGSSENHGSIVIALDGVSAAERSNNRAVSLSFRMTALQPFAHGVDATDCSTL